MAISSECSTSFRGDGLVATSEQSMCYSSPKGYDLKCFEELVKELRVICINQEFYLCF